MICGREGYNKDQFLYNCRYCHLIGLLENDIRLQLR